MYVLMSKNHHFEYLPGHYMLDGLYRGDCWMVTKDFSSVIKGKKNMQQTCWFLLFRAPACLKPCEVLPLFIYSVNPPFCASGLAAIMPSSRAKVQSYP